MSNFGNPNKPWPDVFWWRFGVSGDEITADPISTAHDLV